MKQVRKSFFGLIFFFSTTLFISKVNAQSIHTAGGFGGCTGTVYVIDNCGDIHLNAMDLAGASGAWTPPTGTGCATIIEVGVEIGGTLYGVPTIPLHQSISWAPGSGPVPCPGPPGPSHDITHISWDGMAVHIN